MADHARPGLDFLVLRRHEERISVRRMAKRSGLTRQEVREVEHGDPTVSMVQRYARGLGLVASFDVEVEHRCPGPLDVLTAWLARAASATTPAEDRP